MCDNSELIVGYVYDEMPAAERAALEGHLRTCAACRDEVAALRATRGVLASWAPPEPEFAFRIVRDRRPASTRRWFGWNPAWGLAAAAVLVLAAASAIANVEVRYDASGLAVRTGWGRGVDASSLATTAAATASDTRSLEAKLDALAKRLGDIESTHGTGSTQLAAGTRADDAAVLRQVREMLAQSELRQTRAMQTEIGQVVRDVDRARQLDLKLIDQVVAGHVRSATDQFNNLLMIRASQQPR